MARLNNWELFVERMGLSQKDLELALRCLLEEAKADRQNHGKPVVTYRYVVALPEGVDVLAPLGLFCEKGFVIPIGPAELHMQGIPPDVRGQWIAVLERGGWAGGPIELHSKTCTCTLKVKPFDMRTSTCKQP